MENKTNIEIFQAVYTTVSLTIIALMFTVPVFA
jgi:hypothetical protein